MRRRTRDGTAEPVSRDQILRGAYGDRGILFFPVQLTTRSRIGNLTRLIHTLLYVIIIHTYIHVLYRTVYRTIFRYNTRFGVSCFKGGKFPSTVVIVYNSEVVPGCAQAPPMLSVGVSFRPRQVLSPNPRKGKVVWYCNQVVSYTISIDGSR